jgi:hypothetical protein
VVLILGLLAEASCATAGRHAAIGWSLGGEAHVFIADDDFARRFYRQLTGKRDLGDALAGHALVAVDGQAARIATVLSANGAALARLSLARFHAPQACGYGGIVTELVLAFPPGAAGRAPPSHVTVVALLDEPAFAGGVGTPRPVLSARDAMTLVRNVSDRAERATRGPALGLLHPPSLNPDQATDAGEVVPLRSQYAVGFRTSYVRTSSETKIDTTLITGVALTDPELRHLHWVVRPARLRLRGGMARSPGQGEKSVRYSLRGAVASSRGGALLLVDEIADVSPRDSRVTAVDPENRRVVAAQPLALRCP